MDRIRVKPVVKTYRRSGRKPSIKITVSADIPEIFNSSPVRSPSPQTVVKRIMTFGNEEESDEAFTRITVDDSVMDFPTCIDFGIKDFLCCKDEIDLELSSDTDTSYLEATPPHRFSDSELESQIEIMSITLDNALNLGPRKTSFSSPISKDDTFTFDLLRFEDQTSDNIHPKHLSDDENGKIRISMNGELHPKNGKRLPPPPRPFRRHISLPASILTYLMAEQNFISKSNLNQEKRNSLRNNNMDTGDNLRNNERFISRKLTKIDGSCSSNDSTEAEEISPDSKLVIGHNCINHDHGDSSSVDMASESGSSRDTPIYLGMGSNIGVSGGSAEELGRDDDDQDKQAFTSDLERKSLVLRYMRKLIRQDTSGNFAPPDYCI